MSQPDPAREVHEPVHFRAAEPDDMRFILSSWKRSWRVSPWAGTVRNDEFYATCSSTIEGLVARGAQFRVAYLASHPDRILGWVCHETLQDGTLCVHYLYTKDAFIRYGVGTKLVESLPGGRPGLYSHRFAQVVEACPGFRHAPEVARRK